MMSLMTAPPTFIGSTNGTLRTQLLGSRRNSAPVRSPNTGAYFPRQRLAQMEASTFSGHMTTQSRGGYRSRPSIRGGSGSSGRAAGFARRQRLRTTARFYSEPRLKITPVQELSIPVRVPRGLFRSRARRNGFMNFRQPHFFTPETTAVAPFFLPSRQRVANLPSRRMGPATG